MRKAGAGPAFRLDPPRRNDCQGRLSLGRHFNDRIHLTRVLMSSSLTVVFGGIGTWPHTPTPPFFTLSMSLASAVLSLRYLAATSLKEGATIFLSTAWHAVHPFFFASSSLAKAGTLQRE